jgi:hypothetical protein
MTTITHTSDIYSTMMNRVISKSSFRRTEYENDFPQVVPPIEPTEYDEDLQNAAWKSYPHRRKNYESRCYEAFLAWNRKCLEEMNVDDLNHLSWLISKMETGTLELMDEDVGSSSQAYRFFINANKKIVLTSPR